MTKSEVFAVVGVLIIAEVDAVEEDLVLLMLDVELVEYSVEIIVEEAKLGGEV